MIHDLLNQVILILLLATCVLALFAKLRLPSVLGYLVVGILAGPEVLNILSAPEKIEFLSEIGIILMMFMVGLEFSWHKLRHNLKVVVGTGATCVGVNTLLVMLLLVFLGRISFSEAFFIGGAVAMSSTALVNKQLMDQQELYASHGRSAFSLALFEDIATLVFLTAIPVMSQKDTASFAQSLTVSLVTMFTVLAALYVAGRKIERPMMRFVGTFKSAELFILMTLLLVLGAAWIAYAFHLSAAIGAFLAGMIIGETEFKYRVEEDIRPFRDILMGIFFMGMGMTLKPSVIVDHFPLVLGAVAGIILVKFSVMTAGNMLWRAGVGTSVRVGVVMSHSGEFSLLLMLLAMKEGLVSQNTGQIIMVAVVLSLMLATLSIQHNRAIAFSLLSLFGIKGEDTADSHDEASIKKISGHIILCGFGETGRNLSNILLPTGIPLVVIETDSKKVEAANEHGCRAIYGDASNLKTLKSLGIDRAKALVITFDDYVQTLKILHKVRSEYLTLPIIVRIHHISHVEDLMAFGATTVMPDGIGASFSLGQEIIKSLGIPQNPPQE